MAEALPEYGYNWWVNELTIAEKRLRDQWWRTSDQIIKKYKAKKVNDSKRTYLLNIFWANVGVLKAALYARRPKPMVQRMWADQNDNIGRVASLMLERCLSADFLKNDSPMDMALRLAVEDRLIPGLGCVWLRYECETEEVSLPSGIPDKPVKFEVVKEEDCCCDYVPWRDIVYPSARIWEEVWFIARKCYLEPEEARKLLKKSVDKNKELTPTDQDKILPQDFGKGKVTVYEIWCRKSNKVYWLSKDAPGACREKEDFLHLEKFYPCPEFLMATHTTDDYLPRPDYTMVRDQYDQLNELNSRVTILEKALRVVGVYDSKNDEVKRVLSDAHENDMIPVQKWAVLAEQGGLKGVVDWFPVEVIAEVLDKLKEQKLAKVQEIYELTGISDIMRGATNPRETLGAQELKSQYSSVRLQYTQGEISFFVREALIIKAQIITKFFQDETILKMSNIMSTPDAQWAQQALQLLRDSEMTEYKIDINEEGLALPDYNQEKQTRIEFLTTVGQFLSQAAPITTAIPGALPYLVQMVKWVSASLRGSNEIQGVLDQAILALNQSPPQGQQQDQGANSQSNQFDVQAEGVKAKAMLQAKQMDIQAKGQQIKMTKDLDLRNQNVKGEQELRKGVTLEQIKSEAEKTRTIQQAMVAEQQAMHEFNRTQQQAEQDAELAQGQSNLDHEHAMAQQKSMPRPRMQ